MLEEQTAILAGESGGIPATSFSRHVDFAAVIGGDGTMLHALSLLGDFEKPVAGINVGNLGFLTSCKDDELDAFAAALAEGRFTTCVRTLLEATVYRLASRPLRSPRSMKSPSPAAKPDVWFPSGRGSMANCSTITGPTV